MALRLVIFGRQGAGLLVAVDGLGTPDEVTGRLLAAIDAAVPR